MVEICSWVRHSPRARQELDADARAANARLAAENMGLSPQSKHISHFVSFLTDVGKNPDHDDTRSPTCPKCLRKLPKEPRGSRTNASRRSSDWYEH